MLTTNKILCGTGYVEEKIKNLFSILFEFLFYHFIIIIFLTGFYYHFKHCNNSFKSASIDHILSREVKTLNYVIFLN